MKIIRKILLTALVVFLLAGCSVRQMVKLMKSGEVQPQEFNVKIPFEYRLGLIILKVSISGQEYDFMLDTGASNLISKKLAKKIGVAKLTEQTVGDSQGQSSNLEFTTIEKLTIGDIAFLNTGAAIAELELAQELACSNIDGFIGSNLMRKAIWKFDYQNQIITITNSMESIKINEVTQKIPFSTEITGAPIIDLKINGITEKNVTVDSGSNGDISLSKKTFDRLIKKNPSISYTYSFGSPYSGLYGLGKVDSTFYAKVSTVSFGNVSIQNTIIDFSGESESTIGTEFLKNYEVIINWFNKEIILIKKQKYSNSTLTSFGFSYSKQDNHLIISSIYKNIKGLKIGDQILKIEGATYKTLSQEQWCEIYENGLFKEDAKEIEIVLLRDEKELHYKLKAVKLL